MLVGLATIVWWEIETPARHLDRTLDQYTGRELTGVIGVGQ
jgi:hypothetical protein